MSTYSGVDASEVSLRSRRYAVDDINDLKVENERLMLQLRLAKIQNQSQSQSQARSQARSVLRDAGDEVAVVNSPMREIIAVQRENDRDLAVSDTTITTPNLMFKRSSPFYVPYANWVLKHNAVWGDLADLHDIMARYKALLAYKADLDPAFTSEEDGMRLTYFVANRPHALLVHTFATRIKAVENAPKYVDLMLKLEDYPFAPPAVEPNLKQVRASGKAPTKKLIDINLIASGTGDDEAAPAKAKAKDALPQTTVDFKKNTYNLALVQHWHAHFLKAAVAELLE